MTLDADDYYQRLSEWKKATSTTSKLLIGCLEAIDAALWLSSANRLPQALVLLHNAIETALKSGLECVNPVFIADAKELKDFNFLMSCFKEDLYAHPRGLPHEWWTPS